MLWVAMFLVVGLASAGDADAQYWLNSADGSSGIIVPNSKGSVNYEVSKSRLGLEFTGESLEPTVADGDGKPVIPDRVGWDLDLGFSATDGQRDLFQGGDFVPGVDAAGTVFRQIENAGPGYQMLYVRLAAKVVQNKLVTETAPAEEGEQTLISEKDDVGTSLFASGGYNLAVNEDLVLGLTGGVGYAWNSVRGLKGATVCTNSVAGQDGDGAAVSVSDCSDRLRGDSFDEVTGEVRADVTWNLFALGGRKDGATIGLLGSASGLFGSRTASSANVALGPTIHPPGFPHQLIAAVLLEGIDITNALGNSPEFDDRFRVRLYLSVPFSVFGS